MAKKSIQPILQKQQQDSLSSIADTLKQTNAIHSEQLDTLKNIATYATTDRLIQIGQFAEERKVQQDEDKSLEVSNKTNTNVEQIKDIDLKSFLLQVEQLDVLTNIEKIGQSLLNSLTMSKEDKTESDRAYAEQTALLKTIAGNTIPKKEKEVKPKQEEGFGLSGLLEGLAVAIGSVIGVITAWVENVKLFTPEFLKKSILSSFEKMGKFFDSIVESVIGMFKTIAKSIKTAITNEIELMKTAISENIGLRQISNTIKEMFSSEGMLGKVFNGLKDAVTKFAKPFEEAFTEIKSLLSGPLETLSNGVKFIFEGISKFAKAVKFISKIVGTLATPLLVIMTVWDTVKGALDGYDKGGIMGAIEGAITGFLDSLVGGVLDLIKDIASWVLEKLGFEDASKWLDSFSFSKIIEDFFQAVFHPIELIKKIITDLQISIVEGINSLIEKWNKIAPFDSMKIPPLDVPKPSESPTKETSSDTPEKEETAPAPENVKPSKPTDAKPTVEPVKEEKSWSHPPSSDNSEKKDGTVAPTNTASPSKPTDAKPTVEPVKEEKSWWNKSVFDNGEKKDETVTPTVPEKPTVLEKPKSGVDYLIPQPRETISSDKIYKPSSDNDKRKDETVTPTNTVTPTLLEKPKSGVDYLIPQPRETISSDKIYKQSADNVEAKENKSTGGNISVSSPTVNTSNKTVQNTSVKLPTRNPDTTSNRYVTSRYAVQ